MNLIEALNNKFLNQLFPNGISKDVYVGQINLNCNSIQLGLHIFEKPNIEVEKWGIWGKNYDVIVIHFSAHFILDFSINHWQSKEISHCKLELDKKNDIYYLKFIGTSWEVNINTEGFIFQSCSTYIK